MSDTLRVSNLHFGNAASNYNQPQMGFTSVGIGSTANYGFLQFFGTSNTLCWTANGTVGIGITNPTTTLHVVGSTSVGTPAVVSFVNNGGGQNGTGSDIVNSQITMGLYGPYIRSVQRNSAYTDGMRLDLCTNIGSNDGAPVPRISILSGLFGGYVGIGSTNPTTALDVVGAISLSGTFTKNGTTTGYYTSIEGGTAANSGYVNFFSNGSSRGYIGNANATDMFIVAQNGAQLSVDVAGSRRLSIGTTGNVTQAGGIFYKNSATVNSYMTMNGGDVNNSPFIEFYYGGSRRCYIGNATASEVQIACENGAQFALYTAGSSRLTVTPGGNVGIGIANPSTPLHVVGSSTINVTMVAWMTKGSGGLATSASTSFSTVSIYAAGSIWAGDVVGCANVTSFSDQRIKKDIQSVNDVFDLIQKIEVVSYEHIDKRKKSVKYGVVAQQLRPFLPEVIDTTKNWIPTPFLFATSHTRYGNQVIIAVDASSPELQIGRKIRLYIQYDNKDTEYDTEIINLTPSSITCKVWDTYHDIDGIFVYGVEVDDFLVVDKQQLGLLALAGVQELHKMVSMLQSQNEMLLSQNAALQARMDALEALLTKSS